MISMIKKSLMLLAGIVVSLPLWAQVNVPEPEDPAPVSQECWQSVNKIVTGWGSTDVRYLRSEVATNLKKSISLRAWKGERVAAQAVVSTPADIQKLSFSVSDMKSGSKVIGADNVKKYFVRYVIADTPDNLAAAQLLPDLLSADTEMVVASATTRPVWIDIHVPATAQPGKYKGQLTFDYDGQQSVLPFTLEVIDRTLPEPKDWAFHLDLWQNPYAVAAYAGTACRVSLSFRPAFRRSASILLSAFQMSQIQIVQTNLQVYLYLPEVVYTVDYQSQYQTHP